MTQRLIVILRNNAFNVFTESFFLVFSLLMTLLGRAVVHRQKIPYHLKKAKRLRIKLNERELGNEQSINEHLYQLVVVFCVWFCAIARTACACRARDRPAQSGSRAR